MRRLSTWMCGTMKLRAAMRPSSMATSSRSSTTRSSPGVTGSFTPRSTQHMRALGLVHTWCARCSIAFAERGALIVPTCPFVAGWIRRHPDYSDLVDDAMLRQIKRERSAARRPAEADRAVDRCVHVPDEFARNTVPWPEHGCSECIAAGHRNWVHLRMCQFCGHVGCCDSSPGKHSSGHSELAQHPVIRSYEPGEDWWFCFIDNMTFELADAPPAPSYSP